jgi:FG-GAP-like repeat
MKKRLVVILAIVFAVSFFAIQKTKVESKFFNSSKTQTFSELKPQSVRVFASGVSEKVSSFAPPEPRPGETNKKTADEKARAVPNNLPFRKQVEGAPRDTDAALAKTSAAPMPPPSLTFDGLSSDDNAAAYGFRVIPPDTNGDVGVSYYVQAVNSLVRVFNKQGTPLTPPFKLSSVFAPLGTPCSTRNDGDPIVLYDALADRWVLSQFCNNFPPFRQLIAVSKTNDPTGAYWIYEFVMPNVKLNDYPKIAAWTDAYYMSTDEFLGSDYAGSGAFAFDREKLLTGDPNASYIYFNLGSPTTIRLGGLLPSDFDGVFPPDANEPNIFVGYTATEYGDAQDAVRLFQFHADFANPANSTFTERAESPIAVPAFDPTSNDGRADIFEPAPGEALDAQSDRLMYRAVYRRVGSSASLVFNQTVRVSPVGQPYRGGVRLYELRRNLLSVPPNTPFTVNEAATLGDTNTSRWMGSAAQDRLGNLAVGYSTGDETKKPSIFYSGRLATEPAGTFRTESDLVVGTGVQKAFGFRWGDYSAMSLDPADDCTFWYTNEYYTQASEDESDFGWLTRIGRFKFDECQPGVRANLTVTLINDATNQPIPGGIVKVFINTAASAAPYIRQTQSNGSTEPIWFVPGTHTVRGEARGFRTNSADVSVPPVPAGSTSITLRLQPIAVFENPSLNITAESCTPNNAIDPAETVTVNIALQNTGAQATTNLVATLLPTGGVTNPGAAQNYGALPVGGAAVQRPFTFTASSALHCGDRISLTLQLQDGAENLGTVTINLPTGTPRVAFTENFGTTGAPELPAGWTTSATGAQMPWTRATTRFETPPLSAFSPAPNQVGVNELVSPAFSITSPNAELQFRNWYELETTFLRNKLYDGSVLEIKIGAADWQDIETAGGVFLSGGYDGALDACCQNPLAGRRAWSGRSGINQTSTFITSKAKLPASAAGQTVRLRWRVGTDIGTFREGQYIDDLLVTDGYACTCAVNTARAPFDFDGDGKTDFSVFRPSDSASEPDFIIQNSSNNSLGGAAWGSVADVAANADFDGDGKTDFAVFRPSTNTWFALQSSNNAVITVNFGLAGDKLTPADFDGDGKADIAVFRPSSGTWYVLQSTNGQARIQQFGTAEDLPAPADFDGDDKTDVAVFRPSNGTWYVFRSADNGVTIFNFGLNGDKPVAGDFDADGKADFAVFRPSDRTWYLLRSQAGFAAAQFGLSDDKPLQADFDGDGKADVAVFRPSTNVWYYLKSSDGNVGVKQFGANGDTAVPSIFVY